jgi:hypothetical protein
MWALLVQEEEIDRVQSVRRALACMRKSARLGHTAGAATFQGPEGRLRFARHFTIAERELACLLIKREWDLVDKMCAQGSEDIHREGGDKKAVRTRWQNDKMLV